jgi:hypothetical protein
MQVSRSSSGFAFVNKSYLPDLKWSLRLYASFERFSATPEPFYIVVPRSDLAHFRAAFDLYRNSGSITRAPEILSEEELFEAVGIEIPGHFDGWRTQQVVKLAFGLADLAETYVTIDSAVLFCRNFLARDLAYTGDGLLKTAARRVSRSQRVIATAEIEDKCWLQDKIVPMSEAFDAISQFIGDTGDETHHYISGTCIISSSVIKQLDAFAKERGLSGLAGLIGYCPYECAWYGDFVYIKRPIPFYPTEPNIMWPCVTLEQLRLFESSDFFMSDHHPGILFNPPASTRLEPETALGIIYANDAYRSRALSYSDKSADHLLYPDYIRYRPASPFVGRVPGVTVDGGEAHISGIGGCALYGPGLSISPGLWQIIVIGDCENAAKGTISFEITQGQSVDSWDYKGPSSAVLTQRTFSAKTMLPVEIKIYCSEAASLRVKEFILLKIGSGASDQEHATRIAPARIGGRPNWWRRLSSALHLPFAREVAAVGERHAKTAPSLL